MPRPPHFGRPHLVYLLLLMMKMCNGLPSTTISQYTTTQEPASTDRSDYSTQYHVDDNTDQPFEPNIRPGPNEIDTTALTTEFATTEDGIERYACPEEFLQLTIDWCFHFRYNIDDRLDFTESQDYCSIKDAILPAITSEDVTKALMLERTTVMGISPFEGFYIGLRCNTKKHRWEWMGGVEYDSSLAVFARARTNPKYCVHWNDTVEYGSEFQFDQFGTWSLPNQMSKLASLVVCATRPKGYSPPNPIDAPCTDSWTQLPGGMCYRLYTIQYPDTGLDVYDAEMSCRSMGGHLPAIRSQDQSNLIQAYLTGKGKQNSQFWIGLYCNFGEDYMPGDTGVRAWIDGTPYTNDFTNFLEDSDDTVTCNVAVVDTFLYNGALKGKWQKENYTQLLDTIMCSRPDPEPMPGTSTATTRRTIPPPKTTTNAPEDTTDDGTTSSSDEPEKPEHTTTHAPTTSGSPDKPRGLTILELVLIIILVIIIIFVLVVILVYCIKRCRRAKVQEIFYNVQKRFSRSNTNAVVRTDEWEVKRQFVGIDYSRQLGRGAFGSVYLGRVFSGNIPEMAVKTLLQLNTLKKEDDFVAVKTLHETADRQAASEFLDEINIMKKIGFHERLVNLLACVTETE
ncbi:hypothetical protein PRIPAC_85103, partial [Pristionchus pacificus]